MSKKILFLIACALLFIPGCVKEGEERVSGLEKRMQVVEDKLYFLEGKVEAASQKQDALNEFYQKQAEQKSRAAQKEKAGAMTAMDIQTALKNANFYKGAIDGKIGLATTKAIMDFQTANGLKADGVAGEKTKSLLMQHLTTTED